MSALPFIVGNVITLIVVIFMAIYIEKLRATIDNEIDFQSTLRASYQYTIHILEKEIESLRERIRKTNND